MTQLPASPLLPIPISQYRDGNTGIPYAHALESGKPGPEVAVTALIHGNEVCGAHALDYLIQSGFQPLAGRLTLIFCNVAAYESFDTTEPTASRAIDEDMNRVWAPEVLHSSRSSRELQRAREILPLIERAEFLLDIHSMQTPSPALVLSGAHEKGRHFARKVGVPKFVVADQGHKAGMRMRDIGGFGDPASPRNALLVECGQHWDQASRGVAIETLLRFLVAVEQAAPDLPAHHGFAGQPPAQTFVEVTEAVTIESDNFSFTHDFQGLEIIPKAGTVIAHDGARAIRTPYDNCALIMPTRRLKAGQTAVRLGRVIA